MKKIMKLNVLLILAICAFMGSIKGLFWLTILSALLGGVCVAVYNIQIIELIKKGGQDDNNH